MSTQLYARAKSASAPTPAFMPVRTAMLQRTCVCRGAPGIDGECAECHRKRLSLQRSGRNATASSTVTVPPIVRDVLRLPGQPLDADTRTFMEPRFGHDFSQVQIDRTTSLMTKTDLAISQPGDQGEQEANRMAEQVMRGSKHAQSYDFSQVRIHTDAQAAESARDINAQAYTVGRHIVFGSGQYAPGTTAGQRLLAHELTHVVQQKNTHDIHAKLVTELGQTDQGYTLGNSRDAYKMRNSMRLQRQRISPPPSVLADCTPPSGSPYSRFPSDLWKTICRSFRERTSANKYLDNGFWTGTSPGTPWDALDQYRLADLNSLVEVYQRTKTIGGLWGYVRDIRESWSGGSRGFRFTSTNVGDLVVKLLSQNTNLCEDTWYGGSLHSGHRCWREVVSGSVGLHVCLDEKLMNEADNEIHIDLHQTVTGRELDGKCMYNFNPFGDWMKHMRDVAGFPKSVFERFDGALKMAHELDKRLHPGSIGYSEFKEAYTQLNQLVPFIRKQAARGMQGEQEAEQRVGDTVVENWLTLKKIYEQLQGRRLDRGAESSPF